MIKTFWGQTMGRRISEPWRGFAMALIVGAGASASGALAQTAPVAPQTGISDSAKRAAESPYRWILINADNASKSPVAPAKPAPDARADSAKSRAADKAGPGLESAINAAKPATPKDDRPATAAGPVSAPLPVDPLPALAALPASAPLPALAKASEPIVVAKLDESPPASALSRVPSALVVLTQAPPQLPTRIAREMVMPESIKVQFTVMPDGSVNNPLITASTNRRMNSYVLTAVGQWRYAPIVEARLQEVEFAFKPE